MTTDLEDRLRSDLPRLADQLLAAPEADPPLLPVTPLGRSRRGWLVAAAGAAVLLLVVAVAVAGRPDPERQTTVATTAVTTTAPPLRSWSALPDPPLSPREGTPSIWTGREWLLFGGRDGSLAFNDGAAYDPATGRWRSLTPPISMHPGAQAVWTGDLVAVLAKQGGWIYDPDGDEWSELPLQDDTGSVVFASAAVPTGRDVVVVGYGEDLHTLAARTLDPETEAWGPVTKSPRVGPLGPDTVDGLPAGSAVAGASWDGERVQVWLQDGSGWAFDPAARDWSRLQSLVGPHDDPETMHAVAGTGSVTYQLVSTATGGGTSHQLARFADGRWTLVGPPHDTATADVACRLVAAGADLVALCPRTSPVRIDPSTGAVTSFDDPAVGGGTERSVAWTGSELLVFGGRDAGPIGTTGELTAKAAALTP